MNCIRNERRGITTDPAYVKRIIREYYEQLHAQIWMEFYNLDEMDQFLETMNYQNT